MHSHVCLVIIVLLNTRGPCMSTPQEVSTKGSGTLSAEKYNSTRASMADVIFKRPAAKALCEDPPPAIEPPPEDDALSKLSKRTRTQTPLEKQQAEIKTMMGACGRLVVDAKSKANKLSKAMLRNCVWEYDKQRYVIKSHACSLPPRQVPYLKELRDMIVDKCKGYDTFQAPMCIARVYRPCSV